MLRNVPHGSDRSSVSNASECGHDAFAPRGQRVFDVDGVPAQFGLDGRTYAVSQPEPPETDEDPSRSQTACWDRQLWLSECDVPSDPIQEVFDLLVPSPEMAPRFAVNPGDGWWAAKGRVLTPEVVASHVFSRSRHAVAVGFPEMGRTMILDVDAHVDRGAIMAMREEIRSLGPGAAMREPFLEDEEVIERIRSRALDKARQLYESFQARGVEPIVERSPGRGYHLYLFTERLRSRATRRAFIESYLGEGLHRDWKHVDLFPSGSVCRLPCGRSQALMDVCADGRVIRARGTRARAAHLEAFLSRVEAATVPEGLVEEVASERRQKLRARRMHRVRSARPRCYASSASQPGKDPTVQQFGAAYVAVVQDLLRQGIPRVGTRHHSVLKVCFWWFICQGKSRAETLALLRSWLRDEQLGHLSNAQDLIEESVSDATRYIDRLASHHPGVKGPRRPPPVPVVELGPEWASLPERVDPRVRREVERLLPYVAANAGGEMPLTKTFQQMVCGEGMLTLHKRRWGARRMRKSRKAIKELERLGVLSLMQRHEPGRGRIYQVVEPAMWAARALVPVVGEASEAVANCSGVVRGSSTAPVESRSSAPRWERPPESSSPGPRACSGGKRGRAGTRAAVCEVGARAVVEMSAERARTELVERAALDAASAARLDDEMAMLLARSWRTWEAAQGGGGGSGRGPPTG